jgi:hypothetical protein
MACNNNNNYEFLIKRNDTSPSLRYKIFDCDSSPIDLTEDYTLEASMWSNAKLKKDLDTVNQEILFANNIGFETVSVGTNLLLKTSNSYETLVVTAVDSYNNTITVDRAQLGTDALNWKKGTVIKIIKFINSPATKELVNSTSLNMQGEEETSLAESYLVYDWLDSDTSLPGDYLFEFKVTKKNPETQVVEWTRKYPAEKEGISVKILDGNLEV